MPPRKPLVLALVLATAALGVVAFVVMRTPAQAPVMQNAGNENIALPSPAPVVATPTLSFMYTDKLPTAYINTVDWPPQLKLLAYTYNCLESGSVTDRGGRTEQLTVNGHVYCVTVATEGAAGSTYSQYAYAFARDGGTAVLTFTLRAPQCANYPEPQLTACAKELATFNIDTLVDAMVQSVATATAPAKSTAAIFACDGDKRIAATFVQGPDAPAPKPGEPPTPTGSVQLTFGDGTMMTLPQTISADGARYADKKDALVFWNKGQGAMVLQNGKEREYKNCTVAAAE